MNQADSDRLTLQQYLQTYNIRKKIEQRKKSKSKNKDPLAIQEQQQKMNSIFSTMDTFLEQTKVELQDILINTEIKRDKIIFYVSKLLDELMVKLKDQIIKMYKDVYHHYRIQNSQKDVQVKKETQQYFKDKMVHAIEEKKHTNMAVMVKQNFKKQQKTAFITKLIIGQNVKTPYYMDNNVKSHIEQRQQMTNEKDQIKNQAINPEKPRQNKEEIQLKQLNILKVPLNPTRKGPQVAQPRANSFFEALFGFTQKEDPNSNNMTSPLKVAPVVQFQEQKSPNIKQNQLPSQRGSKIARPFQRKTSIKDIMNSPKGKKLFKGPSLN